MHKQKFRYKGRTQYENLAGTEAEVNWWPGYLNYTPPAEVDRRPVYGPHDTRNAERRAADALDVDGLPFTPSTYRDDGIARAAQRLREFHYPFEDA